MRMCRRQTPWLLKKIQKRREEQGAKLHGKPAVYAVLRWDAV